MKMPMCCEHQRRGLIPAWGNAPGSIKNNAQGLKARFKFHKPRIASWVAGVRQKMDRAFSPGSVIDSSPGALPQAGMDRHFGANL